MIDLFIRALEGRMVELLFETEPPKPDVVVCDMPKPLMNVFPNPCTPMLSS